MLRLVSFNMDYYWQCQSPRSVSVDVSPQSILPFSSTDVRVANIHIPYLRYRVPIVTVDHCDCLSRFFFGKKKKKKSRRKIATAPLQNKKMTSRPLFLSLFFFICSFFVFCFNP